MRVEREKEWVEELVGMRQVNAIRNHPVPRVAT